MDGFNVGLIVVVILSIVAYIAQNIMVKKLWQTTCPQIVLFLAWRDSVFSFSAYSSMVSPLV